MTKKQSHVIFILMLNSTHNFNQLWGSKVGILLLRICSFVLIIWLLFQYNLHFYRLPSVLNKQLKKINLKSGTFIRYKHNVEQNDTIKCKSWETMFQWQRLYHGKQYYKWSNTCVRPFFIWWKHWSCSQNFLFFHLKLNLLTQLLPSCVHHTEKGFSKKL